jgi:hypothetical protein
MAKIEILLTGVAAELVLGSYKSDDTTVFHNWEDFYHYSTFASSITPLA